VEDRSDSVDARLADLERREIEQAQFIADVSHELRTPLTILRGGIEVAIEGDRTADEYRQALSEALVEVQHLVRISENLLFLARGTAGRVTISFARVDLRRFAEERSREFESAAIEKGLELLFEAPARPVGILADPSRLKEVFQNLLENAWKFTAATPAPVISLTACELDGVPGFRVEDNGAGFPEEHAAKLFKPFQRLHSSREFPGNGIGLATVLNIVKRHGGNAVAESTAGEGARFTVTFAGPGAAAPPAGVPPKGRA